MKRRSRDEEQEQRITIEVVVDAYTPQGQATGWYSSLQDRLRFPLVARCITQRSISPLPVGEEVEVAGMVPEEECQHQMFVLIARNAGPLRFPWSSWRGCGGRPDSPGDRGSAVLGGAGYELEQR